MGDGKVGDRRASLARGRWRHSRPHAVHTHVHGPLAVGRAPHARRVQGRPVLRRGGAHTPRATPLGGSHARRHEPRGGPPGRVGCRGARGACRPAGGFVRDLRRAPRSLSEPPRSGPQPVAIVAAPVARGAASSSSIRRTLPTEEPTAPAVTEDPDHIWSAVQNELRQAVPADMYDIWLAPLRAVAMDADVLVLVVPRELRAWVVE